MVDLRGPTECRGPDPTGEGAILGAVPQSKCIKQQTTAAARGCRFVSSGMQHSVRAKVRLRNGITFAGSRGRCGLSSKIFDHLFFFQIERDAGVWQSVEYSSFSVGPESDMYRLSVSGFSGDTDDALAAADKPYHNSNGKQFTVTMCANCGWWCYRCVPSRLNSVENGYWNASTLVRSVKFSRMLVKFD